jgi:PEP-CTERM motif
MTPTNAFRAASAQKSWRGNFHRCCFTAATLGLLLLARLAQAQTLNFTAPNTANPASVTLANGNIGVADTFQLSPQANWNVILSQVLDAQGFTSANGWSYSLLHITSLASNASYTVVNGAGNFNGGRPIVGYKLRSDGGNPSSNNLLDESMHVTFSLGSTTAPAPNGATVTQHWLQILNEDRQYPLGGGGYGFAIPGQSGYWQIDNNDQTFTKGSGISPYYDVNFGGWSTTEVGDDPTVLSDGLKGAYLHFTMLPVWDAQTGTGTNMVDTLYVGDQGFSWGFSVVPEPSTLALVLLAAVTGVIAWRRRQTPV